MIFLCPVAPCSPSLIGIFAFVLAFFLIFSIPVLIISNLTKYNLLSFKRFKFGFFFFLTLAILEPIAFLIYDRATYEPYETQRSAIDIKGIATALELFRAENYSYPTTDEGLDALLINPNPIKYVHWRKYIGKYPLDPWGERYKYLYPGVNSEFDLYTYGPDKVQSEDDIGNWQLDK